MSYPFTKYVLSTIGYSVALLVSLSSAPTLWAHGGSHSGHTSSSGGGAKAHSPSAGKRPERNLAEHPLQPRHNGQVTTTKKHYFEVVYLPKQTRVYVYLPSQRQMNIRSVKGEVIMRVKGNPQEFRYPLKPAFEQSVLSNEPGYLAADIDVSRVPDGAMQVSVALEDLLNDEPEVQFTQTFALSRRHPQVTVSQLTEADRPLIQRQRMCPVMDAELGGHGEPIKLMVGKTPLYVCCEGCVEEVQNNPDKFLRKAAAAAPAIAQPPQRRVVVAQTTAADQHAIRTQSVCPVMDTPLGGHGAPVKLLVDGRPLFVCCQGCIGKVERDPDLYLRKVSPATQVNHRPPAAPDMAFEYPSTAPNMAAEYPSTASTARFAQQGICPVMDQPLGQHGPPIELSVYGRQMFVCCEDCVREVEQHPDLYLAKVVRGQQPDPPGSQNPWFLRPAKQSTSGSGGSCCSSGGGGGSSRGGGGSSCH